MLNGKFEWTANAKRTCCGLKAFTSYDVSLKIKPSESGYWSDGISLKTKTEADCK